MHVSENTQDSGYDQPTSEPSVNLPDCSQSSCEDIEDKETLDAPSIDLVAIPWQTQCGIHTKGAHMLVNQTF
jgi:hypothetical protein